MLKLTFLFVALWATSAQSQTYRTPQQPPDSAGAPGLSVHLLDETAGKRTYLLVFAKGDEVLSGLNAFARKHHIRAAHLTGIGALSQAQVGWFDKSRKAYKVIPVDRQSEVVSLIGDIGVLDGKPVTHVHVALADENGAMTGGHLLEGWVWPTLEVFLTTYRGERLLKKKDPETGLTLFEP